MAAIPGSQVVEASPYTDWGVGDYLIPGRTGETWEDWGGLRLPDGMSGKQANRIIESLKGQGVIQ